MGKYSVLGGFLLVLSCGGAQAGAPAATEPSSAGPATPSAPAQQPQTQGAKASATTTTTEAAAPKRERIRLHNSCSKPVPLRIERDHDSDTDTSLGNNTSTEEHASDGDEIRLLDDRRNVLSSLKIEPSTQEINVTSDCSKLEAK